MKRRVATLPLPSSLETCGWIKSPADLIHGSTAVCVARICGNIVNIFSVLWPSSSSSSLPAQESSTSSLTVILSRSLKGCQEQQDWAAPRKLLSVPRCPLAVPPSGFGSIGPQLQILCDESLQYSLVCEALLIITTAIWVSTSSWGRPSTTSTSTRTSRTLTTSAQTTYFR